ncbi:MAG: hypothetical protein B1H06_01040 [Candidatus Cloacimonas sp. 4484_143]|nr:MAG: hypothetical protein B1H06_01040 [Candidatus Cloacimonas sp. 4484_143]RLC53481.1 MAG: hypothetical protein DRI23_00035 [Candidatus Cloacimonadota bacterium]RLC58742.1 MAG: hypothetical protein DRH89_00290 [Candidatus Cloacimonadota bacterium]HHE64980.1 hypothetical protein [Bacteroidota bacterium]
MLRVVIALSVIISGCVFGSIMQFSEIDIKDAENTVFNSSFEIKNSEDSKLPDGWMALDELENTVSWDNQNSASGERSLKIAHARKKVNIISDSFPIDPESVYFTRCLIKSNYKSNHAVTIRFLAFDSKGKQLNKFTEKYYPDTDWTTMRLTTGFFKTAARFGRIVVSFPSKPDKVFWLDDLESYSVYRIQK